MSHISGYWIPQTWFESISGRIFLVASEMINTMFIWIKEIQWQPPFRSLRWWDSFGRESLTKAWEKSFIRLPMFNCQHLGLKIQAWYFGRCHNLVENTNSSAGAKTGFNSPNILYFFSKVWIQQKLIDYWKDNLLECISSDRLFHLERWYATMGHCLSLSGGELNKAEWRVTMLRVVTAKG